MSTIAGGGAQFAEFWTTLHEGVLVVHFPDSDHISIPYSVDSHGVVALHGVPAVAGRARLSEYEVVRAEDLADRVHGARLEVHQDVVGHVAAAGRLAVVHVASGIHHNLLLH